jgi:hypothetical protein
MATAHVAVLDVAAMPAVIHDTIVLAARVCALAYDAALAVRTVRDRGAAAGVDGSNAAVRIKVRFVAALGGNARDLPALAVFLRIATLVGDGLPAARMRDSAWRLGCGRSAALSSGAR